MQLSLKSVEILLQAAVRGGLIGSLLYCALQYFSNADLFHLSKALISLDLQTSIVTISFYLFILVN